jgi:hydroxypyruvate isomerase
MKSKLKPSVCIDAVLEKFEFEQALRIVSEAGLAAFEFWGWWDKDLDALQAAQATFNLEIAACCTKFISLVDPAKRDDYLVGLEESIATAKTLNCKTLVSQVGDFRIGVERSEQHQCLVDGLKEAVPLLSPEQITLVIEPLNVLVDHAGYFLIRSDEAFDIIDEVGSSSVKVVFDIYHQQISEGHLIHNITANINSIGHFHAAGNPGRHELTKGEIHYPSVLDAIQATGFEGFFGLEYWPLMDPAIGLREVAQWFT